MSNVKKAAGKSLDDFRAAHDSSYIVPTKIKAALADLGEGWEYEAEFSKRAGLCNTDFAKYREQFSDFYVNVGGARTQKRVWAGTKAFATKLREKLS
jgi:hypothetical protein